MTRVLIALAGVVLLAVTALAAVWLAGQLLAGLGAFVVGASTVLWKLLWFLVMATVLGGLVLFVTSAWRPGSAPTPAARPFGTAEVRDLELGRPVTPQPPDPTLVQRLVISAETGPDKEGSSGPQAPAGLPPRSDV